MAETIGDPPPDDMNVFGSGTPLLQIYEHDLRSLEQYIPLLTDVIPHAILAQRPDLVDMMERCKSILSDVRWNYMPSPNYGESEIIPLDPLL